MKNSNHDFDYYIHNEFNEALAWRETPDAAEFLGSHPKLAWLGKIDPYEDTYKNYIISRTVSLDGCFTIKTPLYVGESRREGRLWVHLWHLSTDPQTYFGLSEQEVEQVEIDLDSISIEDPDVRKARELELRRFHLPILNPPEYGDRCIPRRERYDAVHSYFNDPISLQKRIDFLFKENGHLAYDLHALLRKKTPCCWNEEMDFPYGVERRTRDYITSMDKSSKAALLRAIAVALGGGFYVQESTAWQLISRILAAGDPLGGLRALLFNGLEKQIETRQAVLGKIC